MIKDLKTRWKIKSLEIYRFIHFVIYHFIQDDCTYRASALAFVSLLAIVPLMAVSLAIISSFPVFNHWIGPIQDFIFANFVPTTGKTIQVYLQFFTTQVSKLPIFGIAFLFITAFLVMYTVERSMNKIWKVSVDRGGVAAFLLYWAILSLAPFLVGLSLVASSYFFSMPLVQENATHSFLFTCIPFILSLTAFTFLYLVVPNCQVGFSHAFQGALVATVLFEGSKEAFAYYLTQFNVYQLLYGAFATIPIFFIWVYWVWLITLLGAEISYAKSVHYKRREGKPISGFYHALLWLNQLWLAQLMGTKVSLEQLINVSQRPFEIDIGVMITQLSKAGLIQTTNNGQFILSRDLSHLTLYQLTQLLPYRLPNLEELTSEESPINKRWYSQLRKAGNVIQQELEINLNQLFDE